MIKGWSRKNNILQKPRLAYLTRFMHKSSTYITPRDCHTRAAIGNWRPGVLHWASEHLPSLPSRRPCQSSPILKVPLCRSFSDRQVQGVRGSCRRVHVVDLIDATVNTPFVLPLSEMIMRQFNYQGSSPNINVISSRHNWLKSSSM